MISVRRVLGDPLATRTLLFAAAAGGSTALGAAAGGSPSSWQLGVAVALGVMAGAMMMRLWKDKP